MQTEIPCFSEGETTSRPNIDNVWRVFDYFRGVVSRTVASSRGGADFYIFVYLALAYLKPLPELGLALPLQRKKLSDVMAADN